ncbi:hypothetical protein C3489_06145 [Streptomyces sp. Ru71]|nr:hypothetical protein C3489_06145 [Streptomyces sp. Ru71]
MTADVLAPYRKYLTDPAEHELADRLLHWACAHCACPRGPQWHARRAFYAAVFSVCCRPPGATWQETLLAGKFNVFYFNVDDGPAEELTRLTGHLHHAVPADTGELGNLHRALLTDLRALGLDTARLEADIAALCAAADAEDRQDIATLSPERFHTLRLTTVASTAYISCWGAIRRLPLSGEESAVEAAGEAIYLANDLASLERDSSAQAPRAALTSNFVLFHAARTGTGIPHAADMAVARYNRLTADLASRSGPVADVLAAIVDGNLDAHLRLTASRFPGATDRLRLLHRVRTDPSAAPDCGGRKA